jgi:hypothetical protein
VILGVDVKSWVLRNRSHNNHVYCYVLHIFLCKSSTFVLWRHLVLSNILKQVVSSICLSVLHVFSNVEDLSFSICRCFMEAGFSLVANE